jgi:F-type H+-transporting ATPase subunit c
MENLGPLLHYSSIGFIVALTSLGVGIGGGKASTKALQAINIAPTTYPAIFRAIIISLALIETSAILGIVMALFLILGQPVEDPQRMVFVGIGEWGIAFALGISGALVGILSSLPAQQAVFALARQPFFSTKILNSMLITQSIVQTPVIFSFLIALFIKTQLDSVSTLANSIRLLASGICIGIGSIGPTLGLARFAKVCQESISINRDAYSTIMPFTFISQAIIETPIIFAVLISMILLLTPVKPDNEFMGAISCLATALCASFGTLGPGISSGTIASAACREIAIAPENSSIISRTSILGQGIIDAAAMYALLVSLIIIILR